MLITRHECSQIASREPEKLQSDCKVTREEGPPKPRISRLLERQGVSGEDEAGGALRELRGNDLLPGA